MHTLSVLQRLHDSELNWQLSAFFDGVITVSLGDEMNGYAWSDTYPSVEKAVDGLVAAALEMYPESKFAEQYHGIGL